MSAQSVPEKAPKYQRINGFNFAPQFPAENIASCLAYEARDDDVFVVTYPKNGTTWTQQILILLFNEGEIPDDVQKTGLYCRSPFLEMLGAKAAEEMPRPGAIKTHLPFHLQPYNPQAKYIVVLRNPKDAVVSFYHHTAMFPAYEFQGEGASFHEYFKHWMNGDVECGSYFDWVLTWWSHRSDPNVLVLFYEDMKADIKKNIRKIASFLGKDYKDLTSDPEVLDNIVQKSSFGFMKNTLNKTLAARNKEQAKPGFRVEEGKFNFIRKGEVGDHVNYFTPEEDQLMAETFRQMFSGTGLEMIWQKYGLFCESTCTM